MTACRHNVVSKIVQERYGIVVTNVLDFTTDK